MHLEAATEWTLMAITVGLIVLVIWLAHGRFVKKTTIDPEAEEMPFLQRLIARKWMIDELYAALFEKPYDWLSRRFASTGEGRIMIPAMTGTGRISMKVGQLLRRAQSGSISLYLFGMVFGIVLFLAITLYSM
jgi:NADH-quinone oxidoreductase subunit L